MRVAVTGSSGLIGTALCRALSAQGHDVVRLVRPSGSEPGPDRRPGVATWDPDSGQIDRAGVEGIEGVVHLAGAGIGDRRWSAARRQLLVDSRVRATEALVASLCATSSAPRVLVSASAVGYYGSRGDEELDEHSESGEGFLAELCEAWEGAARLAADAGMRVAMARSGIVLDRDGGALARLRGLFRLALGGRLGNGRQWTSWITLEDEVRALAHLLQSDMEGPVNLTAPYPVTNAQFTAALAGALHRPAVLHVPATALRLVLGRDMADEVLLASQRVKPRALETAGFTFLHAEIEGALAAALGT
ncbi:MAG: TIGR01777 family oxidoreductase [Acidimicrobiales bacterium]